MINALDTKLFGRCGLVHDLTTTFVEKVEGARDEVGILAIGTPQGAGDLLQHLLDLLELDLLCVR